MGHSFLASAQRVFEIETHAISTLARTLTQTFNIACDTLLQCQGKVVVCGIGKSGLIGQKISSTFASTGTPSFFMHPAEASHGDLGMLEPTDVLIAISNSGESSEIIALLPAIKRKKVPIIALTSNEQSTLGQYADIHLSIFVEQEACSLGLAPTSSTTATLVMGDALAVALLDAKGFTSDDFALSHPGGSLGKKLLVSFSDIMHTDDALPVADESQFISDVLLEISNKRLGFAAITDSSGQLSGIFTDGDLRRIIDAKVNVHDTKVQDVMTKHCKTITPNALAVEALNLMEQHKISGLIAIDENRIPVGAANIQDLLKAGIM
jgi:arabinose-5-phosphate isomerase